MNAWTEHSHDTWLIQDTQHHVVSLIHLDTQTNLYHAQKLGKNLGLYTTLVAAQCAATPCGYQSPVLERNPRPNIPTPWS